MHAWGCDDIATFAPDIEARPELSGAIHDGTVGIAEQIVMAASTCGGFESQGKLIVLPDQAIQGFVTVVPRVYIQRPEPRDPPGEDADIGRRPWPPPLADSGLLQGRVSQAVQGEGVLARTGALLPPTSALAISQCVQREGRPAALGISKRVFKHGLLQMEGVNNTRAYDGCYTIDNALLQ